LKKGDLGGFAFGGVKQIPPGPPFSKGGELLEKVNNTKEEEMKTHLKLIGMVVMLMALYGCGGGGGSSSSGETQVADSDVFPAGKATLTFTAMSSAQLPAPISQIDLSITLPSGMSVDTTNANGDMDTTSSTAPVKSGSALQWAGITGNYTASTGKVLLGMFTTGTTFRSGEFLRLTCNVASGSTTTLGGLKTLNPSMLVKASGVDTTNNTTVDLTGKVTVTLGAVR
jgi:hypothetical protein